MSCLSPSSDAVTLCEMLLVPSTSIRVGNKFRMRRSSRLILSTLCVSCFFQVASPAEGGRYLATKSNTGYFAELGKMAGWTGPRHTHTHNHPTLRQHVFESVEAESTLVETEAQETEGRSKKRSSKDDNQCDTAAASEAESTIVDTVAHETEGKSKKHSSKDDEQRGTVAALEAESTLVDTVVHETEGAPRCAAAKQAIYGVVLLISSTDVRTGGRLHPVEETMKRIAVSTTRQAHNHS